MGIGCRRDPLEANVWYVRAAEQGDERAKQRLATIRAAASGQSGPTVSGTNGGGGTTEKLRKRGKDGKDGKDDKDCIVM